jgi:hypothetical protein
MIVTVRPNHLPNFNIVDDGVRGFLADAIALTKRWYLGYLGNEPVGAAQLHCSN